MSPDLWRKLIYPEETTEHRESLLIEVSGIEPRTCEANVQTTNPLRE